VQYRVYDRQTLVYKDGGYVKSYNIDDDYIVNNNSTFTIVKKSIDNENTLSRVMTGDIVALIKDSGAYHKGVVTAVDDTACTISYKSDKELFNDSMYNAFIREFIGKDDSINAAGKFGVDVVVEILKAWFVDTADEFQKLPMRFTTVGNVLDAAGKPKMLWSWSSDSIKVVDWLTELFTLYNLSLSWTVDFDIAENDLTKRTPQYICTLSALTNSGEIIKDNVAMQTITYTTKELPDATVCIVIDSESKEIINTSSGKNLLNPQAASSDCYIRYQNDDVVSSSFVTFTDRYDSILSGFIRMRQPTDNNPNKYTYSQASGDVTERYIIAYNSNQKGVGYMTYTPQNSGEFSVTFDTHSFTMVGKNTYEDIKWFRVCYSSSATKAQIEKGDSATAFDPYDIPSIYYLYEKDGVYSVETKRNLINKMRVLPVRTVVATYSESNTDSEGLTPYDVAKEKLIPSQFNQSIQIKISADSKMFDFENAHFGDLYKIINEHGSIDSNYTGRKSTNDDKWVTLYFGLGRQNYTDLMQMRLRKERYPETYNQA